MEKLELPLSELAQMYQSEAWKSHMESLKEIVGEAYEAMVGSISSDPQVAYHLKIRWQQREAMLRASLVIAEDTIKAHNEELEQFNRDFEKLSSEAQ
jgi:hypothetical protein